MKRVYVSADPIQCGWLESVLEAAEIACLVRNRYLGGAIGELPLNEAWPEIWVIEDRDEAAAKRLIEQTLAPQTSTAPWHCSACNEMIEGQFRQCWQCGAERPAQGS